jgi:hypothetical protein
MRTEEDDWDNLSDVRLDFPDDRSVSLNQSVSLSTCRDTCLRTEDCFQYRFSEGECDVQYNTFKLGSRKLPEKNGRRWYSGWDVKKIQQWRDTHPCKQASWKVL